MAGGKIFVPWVQFDTFIKGERFSIKVTKRGNDNSEPLWVRNAMVGKIFHPDLTSKQVNRQVKEGRWKIPKGSCVASLTDVAESLDQQGEPAAANAIRQMVNAEMHEYLFEKGKYKIV